MDTPQYVQGNYSVAERDRIFAKADSYPDASGGLTYQVPTLMPNGSIAWRQQSSGGGDGTANANLAVVEPTTTASQAYAVGDLLVYGGQLYEVTAAISAGGTITPGTNVTPTTMGAYVQEQATDGVTSFNGRTGAVAPQSGDYTAQQIAYGSDSNVADALVDLHALKVPMIGKGINLLDNAYFIGGGSQQGGGKFPINQRGQTSYTVAGYGIDRWQLNSGAYEMVSGGLESGSDTFWNVQKIEKGVISLGKTYTVSALIDEELYTATGKLEDTSSFIRAISSGTDIEVTLAYDSGSGLWHQSLISRQSHVFAAVKLELGDTQTLAHQENGSWVLNDPPPNYQQELAKCQRYYQRFMCIRYPGITSDPGSAFITAVLPVPMAKPPAIVPILTGGCIDRLGTNRALSNPRIVNVGYQFDPIVVQYTTSGLEPGPIYVYDTSFELSAEL